jgi:hypothetical protein
LISGMSDHGDSGGDEGGPGAKPPARPDGNPAPAVVAIRMEDVTHWVVERVAKMPREHKFAIGDKLVEACLEVTCALVEATYVRDKLGLLAQASRTLVRARALAPLASRSKLVSNEQLAHFERETVEVGRMLGGWTRSVRRR